MSLTTAEQQLNRLEAQFQAVSDALLAADPEDLHSSSAALQQLAVEFLQLRNEGGFHSVNASQLELRLQGLAQGMLMVRESLLRRNAYVERALAVLVPQAQAKTTYSDSSAPYGSAVRVSRQFKGLAA
jgi:hypothetical protein